MAASAAGFAQYPLTVHGESFGLGSRGGGLLMQSFQNAESGIGFPAGSSTHHAFGFVTH
jgi:hypothetical protein